MTLVKEPMIRIPKTSRGHRRLVAIPEEEYRRYQKVLEAHDQELADLRQSVKEVRAGRVIRAESATEALKEARARGWLD